MRTEKRKEERVIQERQGQREGGVGMEKRETEEGKRFQRRER